MINQISTEEMRALLDQVAPTMSPPTRHVLITGQAKFVDAHGNEYQAPRIKSDDDGSPTHFVDGIMFRTERNPKKCS